MKNRTEITLINEDGSENFFYDEEGLMELKVGDKFYFSMRGTSPRSEDDYYDINSEYKREFLNSFVDNINEKCHEFHINEFEVISSSNSLSKDYSINISEPTIKFVKSYRVKEVSY
jgi:hypothetical protein